MAANKVTAVHRLAPPAKDYSEPSEWKLGGSFLLPGSVAAKSDVACWRLGGCPYQYPLCAKIGIPEGRRLIQTRLGA
jgi:hypothetical protein